MRGGAGPAPAAGGRAQKQGRPRAVVAGMATATKPLAVVAVDTRLVEQRLRVDAVVRGANGERRSVRVPDRELAALLPRSILASGGSPPEALLDTIRVIVGRLLVGRRVRVWEYRDQHYLSFLSWRNVRFSAARPAPPAPTRPPRSAAAPGYTPNDSMSRSVSESSTSALT